MNEGELRIINGNTVWELLRKKQQDIVNIIENAYTAHHKAQSSLPHSVFLRFPNNSKDRIIGLPAYIGGEAPSAGIKWIASFPDNITRHKDRASAAIILNSTETGQPYAFLEASIISAKRTAASAALASTKLNRGHIYESASFIGTGLINYETLRFVSALHPTLRTVTIFDLSADRARQFANKAKSIVGDDVDIRISSSLEEALGASKLIAIATTAATPYLANKEQLQSESLVLHTSLRDITPEVILDCTNVVDDLDHVNRENTSIHLASQKSGSTDFVHGSLGAFLQDGNAELPADKPVIFSPFGLGVLDMALARFVYERAIDQNAGEVIRNFLPQTWIDRAD